VAETNYTHVSKSKNDKIKGIKKKTSAPKESTHSGGMGI
jgi:hypothetical protein